jgi:hypothetical protein
MKSYNCLHKLVGGLKSKQRMSSIGFSYGYISSLRDQCKKKIEEKGEGTSKKEVTKNRVNPVNSSDQVDSDGNGSSIVSATSKESASK